MSRELLVFRSPEPRRSEANDQEANCADGACAIPSTPDTSNVVRVAPRWADRMAAQIGV
jgi:hypothetical protein